MAQENLDHFYQIAAQDQELQEKLKAAIDSEAFVKLVVELGEEKGYKFTTQELKRAIIEAEEKKGTEALWQEFNERELEVVAGGRVCAHTANEPWTRRWGSTKYICVTSKNPNLC